jgi:hypothetical protein
LGVAVSDVNLELSVALVDGVELPLEGGLLSEEAPDLTVEEVRVGLEGRVELVDLCLQVWHDGVNDIVQADDGLVQLCVLSLQRCDLRCGQRLEPSALRLEDRLRFDLDLGLGRLEICGCEELGWLEICNCQGSPELVDDPVGASMIDVKQQLA